MEAEEGGGNPLLKFYRRYIGEPINERDVYVGFALFFGGIALGAVGLVVFLYSAGLEPGEPAFWQLREVALAAAAVGLPVFILSIVVLLPVGRRVSAAAVIGAAVCGVAVAGFVAVYPANWNVQTGMDYSAQGIAVYAVGLTVLVGSTGSALIAQYLEQARPTPEELAAAGGSEEPASGRSGSAVTDESVRRDIEESLSGAELSWGGVRKRETKRLKFKSTELDAGEIGGFDGATVKSTRSGGTDDAVAGLKKLRGGERKTAAGRGTDDQIAALKALRAQQNEEPEEPPDRFIDRVKRWLGR